MTATTSTERLGVSLLRIRLGAALQKHRLRQGLTQGQLADRAEMSLKYIGQIERGEANTTLTALERLAAAVGWDPMDAMDDLHEPLSEGVRMLLLDEVQQMVDRLTHMNKWLQAIDPALQSPRKNLAPSAPPAENAEAGRRSARPSRKTTNRAAAAAREGEPSTGD